MRRLALLFAAVATAAMATATVATGAPAATQCSEGDGDWITRACYGAPRTSRLYGHNILGDTPEWGELRIVLGPVGRARLAHDKGMITLATLTRRIIEDIAPRVVQINATGPPEIMLVETDFSKGARLAVLDLVTGGMVATPFIGTRYRWLAPLGAADLDGDGTVEIAYIDRPHLARTLRIWRFEDNALVPVAEMPGLTNHRIGEDHISGGIRNCGTGPEIITEIITANADWTRLIASTLSDERITSRDIGPHAGPASFAAALACR